MRLPIKKRLPIAVDIGAGSLRAMQFERKHDRITIRHWTHQVIPQADDPDPSNGDLTNGLSAIQPVGWDLFGGREVVTTIGPPELEVCSLQVPGSFLNLERHKLLQSIRQEAARQINYPIDSVEMDCWPLQSGHGHGANLMVGAVRREVIERIIKWSSEQGYLCSRIDLAPLSTLRGCARIMSDLPRDQLWGVLDVGERASRLYLAVGETPVYVRTLPCGAREMTKRIADELGVKPPIAERYKRHYGIRGEETGYRPMLAAGAAMDEDRMASILSGVLNPLLHDMAGDIEKSFRYGLALYPELPVNCLILAGGGGCLEGLDEVLGHWLGIRVRRMALDESIDLNGHHATLTGHALLGMANCFGLSFGADET